MITAYRPGVCAGCDLDILPGAKITYAGEGRYATTSARPADSHDGPLVRGDDDSDPPGPLRGLPAGPPSG